MREPCDPGILYDPNYSALTYRGRNLSLSRLQAGLNELVSDTWSRLLALSGNSKVKVQIPESMSEDVRSTEEGHSFIDQVQTDPKSLPLLFEMSKHLGTSLLQPVKPVDDGANFQVDPSTSQEFFHKIKPIIEAIAFLIHVTGSGPLRLTEVADDRHRNGSSPRNLLVAHGLVFLLRRNLKPSSFKGHRSSVFHFPPPKVTELIIYYLAVVRPVEVFLTAGLGWSDQLSAYSEFLYVVKGQKLFPRQLSDIIARYTDRYFGCRLTGLDLRHVLVNIQAVFLPPIVDPSVQKFRDSQAGHSTRIANHVYGQRMDDLPGEQAAGFVLSHTWCRKLHTLLGLGPEGFPVQPIPFLHAPPEPTWWSPTDYIPAHPPSLQENVVQMRLIMSSALSSVTDELAKRCEKILSESVFRAYAASSATMAPNPLSTSQAPPPSPYNPQILPSVADTVSFPSTNALQLSYPFLLQPNLELRPRWFEPARSGGHVGPVIQKATGSPPPTLVEVNPDARHFMLRSPPRPSPTALLMGYAAQADATARKRHCEAIRELMIERAGCFGCRIGSDSHTPCHDVCGNSGMSGCMVDEHMPYSCKNYPYNTDWIDWKKSFDWPVDTPRCHFCGFPISVLPLSHQEGDALPGICQFSDTALVAAWHVLHSPGLLEKLQNDFGFVLNEPNEPAFATWLVQYGSDSEEIHLLSVFSWLCCQYYPNHRPFS